MNPLESVKSQVQNIHVAPSWAQAGIIVFLIFLLLVVMARMTRSYLSWYTSGWWVWTGLGFVLAIIIEGFFILSGGTIFTSVLGWKTAPAPVQSVIDTSRERLKNSFGEETPSDKFVIESFSTLSEDQKNNVKAALCSSGE